MRTISVQFFCLALSVCSGGCADDPVQQETSGSNAGINPDPAAIAAAAGDAGESEADEVDADLELEATVTAPLVAVSAAQDAFGTEKIYPTKANGPEWYVNMAKPASGSFTPGAQLTRQSDGSWQVNKDGVRMNARAPSGAVWKNVEITGYVKMIQTLSTNNGGPQVVWYARGGRHSTTAPCDGTSVKGYLKPDGQTFWKKELWHTGGYTPRLGNTKIPSFSATNKWVGFKTVMWNTAGDKGVRVQVWVDKAANNRWQKVVDNTDTGQACAPQQGFSKPGCKNPKTGKALGACDVVTWGTPSAVFRSDGLKWNFRNLSVREIEPPKTPR